MVGDGVRENWEWEASDGWLLALGVQPCRAPGPGGVAAATTLIAAGRWKEKDRARDLSGGGGAVRYGGRRRRDALFSLFTSFGLQKRGSWIGLDLVMGWSWAEAYLVKGNCILERGGQQPTFAPMTLRPCLLGFPTGRWFALSHTATVATWMIWSIMYTVICTYPDMSYALNVMSIYQSDKFHKMITEQ
jgi:hypothetical protein